MTYQWKLPGLIPIPAQTAGEELERIYAKHGALSAAGVVQESRPEDAPLHPCFEWDDAAAAEKYREHQARNIINAIVVRQETPGTGPVEVRAFPHDVDAYRPLEVIVSDADKMLALLDTALAELRAFEHKYSALKQLYPVFQAAQEVEGKRPHRRAGSPMRAW